MWLLHAASICKKKVYQCQGLGMLRMMAYTASCARTCNVGKSGGDGSTIPMMYLEMSISMAIFFPEPLHIVIILHWC